MAKIRFVSRSGEPFRDRQEAGMLLGRELAHLRGKGAVVLGVPRGGIIIARELAGQLKAELDIVLAHKLRTPGHPELAMGAIAEDGSSFLNESVVRSLGVEEAFIEQEKSDQTRDIVRRAGLFRRVRPKVPLAGKVVIVTDDGVATGATTQAAFWAVRKEGPARLIAAIPVGAEDSLRQLAEGVDEMVCLRVPPYFAAVGQFYERFAQVEDEEVLDIIREERAQSVGK